MTHPLTDKQLFIEFLSLGRDYCPDNRNGFSYDDMRAVADWQLEQVIEWLNFGYQTDPNLSREMKQSGKFKEISIALEKAMRPQQQPEES